jgi:myo-inositol-1(or 4)-monophosphatase
LTLDLIRDLAFARRGEVLPLLGTHAGRAHADALAAGGDITFKIDEQAETLLGDWMASEAPDVAFDAEDRGLVDPGDASTVLVVDPIDGTRPAMAGLESCCVSIAAAPLRDGVTMGEVTHACVLEIPSGNVFLAERGKGLVESPPITLSANERLDRMFFAYGFRGRPARAMVEVLGDLIDASSVGGGGFKPGRAAFDMTRILTGQFDAYVEPGPALIEAVPEVRAEFERVGGGAVLNNSPYDVAAAVLCLEEGGAVVTDARGRPLSDRPLLGSGAEFQMSIAAAGNVGLHAQIVEQVQLGLARLRVGYDAGGRQTA